MKKTAFVLSGGGSRGGYEIGVWEALRELNIRPDMVLGTSVGAINGAMIAQGDLELSKKLWLGMETDMIFDLDDAKEEIPEGLKERVSAINVAGMPAENALAYGREIVLSGGAGSTGLQGLLNKYINEDKVRSSGLVYGLVATEFPGFRGHFLTLDDITPGNLISFITASASCFPAVQKYVINDKTYIDGGYSDNMPIEMALNHGATHIIAVNLEAAGIVRHSTIKRGQKEAEDFRIIKSSHDLGSFLLFDKKNTSRMIRLGYLDTMRCYGGFDGEAFTFEKNALDKHSIIGGENTARILGLDPCVIYNSKTLLAAAHKALAEHKKSETSDSYLLDKGLGVKEMVSRIKADLNNGELSIAILTYIAESLIKDEADSLFLRPPLFGLLEGHIKAANFMIKKGLIQSS